MKGKNVFTTVVLVAFVFLSVFVSNAKAQCVDSIIVSDAVGAPGDTGVVVPVYGRVCGLDIGGNLEDLDGVSFAMQYDTSLVVCEEVLYDVSDPVYPSFHDSIPNPFFWAPYIDPSGYVTVGLAFAMLGTPDIPPGYYRMFDLVFRVKPGAASGDTPLDIEDGVGDITNAFTYVTTDIYPEKVDGVFTIGEFYGSIVGVVMNAATTAPIKNVATVTADGIELSTDAQGEYFIQDLPTGSYDVVATAPVCLPDTAEGVVVNTGETTVLDFGLVCLDSLWMPDKIWGGRWLTRIVPVYGKFTGWLDTNDVLQDLDGISIAFRYDPDFLMGDSVVYDISDPDVPCLHDSIPEPWFWGPYIDPSGWITVGVAFAMLGEPDIPPGRYHLFDIYFHKLVEDEWTEVEFADGAGGLGIELTYVTTRVFPWFSNVPCSVYTLVEEVEDGGLLPSAYLLAQNYPNPFNPKTGFLYSIPRRSMVRLEIFNLLGERIKILVNEEEEGGNYKVTWDGKDETGSSVASGVYLYRLRADGFSSTRKMVLLR